MPYATVGLRRGTRGPALVRLPHHGREAMLEEPWQAFCVTIWRWLAGDTAGSAASAGFGRAEHMEDRWLFEW